jgi:hypothetical protein
LPERNERAARQLQRRVKPPVRFEKIAPTVGSQLLLASLTLLESAQSV